MLEERGKTDLLATARHISDMIHIAYVRRKEAMGLGHAVLMARELVGDDEPFAVILADDIIDSEVPCLKQMIEVYNETRCSVLAAQVVEGPAITRSLPPARGRSAVGISLGLTRGNTGCLLKRL